MNPEDISIEYIEDGLKWLINLRKGIISVFKNEVLKGNVENQIPNPSLQFCTTEKLLKFLK
ncbi:hypothetical protein Avbf_08424 [Armadillidium vulgare]|nr:hypothetical protein Avbf_08424 [Armadillidium vulgare]